jgi:hypothetical protein
MVFANNMRILLASTVQRNKYKQRNTKEENKITTVLEL